MKKLQKIEITDQVKGVAIIGMAGRFLATSHIDESWHNLENGRDCITLYKDQLQAAIIHDNFFDLGGHSLLATLFLSQLQDQYQIRLEMRTIFEEPAIASIAEGIEKEREKIANLKKIEDLLDEVEEEIE